MTNEYFKGMYTNYLEHKWVTSSDRATAEKQKEREREYNRWYYEQNRKKDAERRRAQANAYNESRKIDARQGRLLTSEQALRDLNEQQRQLAGPQGPSTKPVNYEGKSDMEKVVYEGMVQDIMKRAPLATRTQAETWASNIQARNEREARDVAERNERARQTGLNQGASARSAEQARRQSNTLRRRSSSDTNASVAQMQNASRNRQKHLQTQRNTLMRRSSADTNASIAQTKAAESRNATYNSFENKIRRSISRGTKRVGNLINKGKAAATKVRDTAATLSRGADYAKKLISKYFG